MTVEVRTATAADDDALARIDAATWDGTVSPAPPPEAGTPFFDDSLDPGHVLVAEVDGAVVGYAALGDGLPIPAHAHVLRLRSLAVAPGHTRRGVGRRLVAAAVAEARRRGARKLALRVLGTNDPARRVYEACGFEVEGVLRDEFRLGGRFVDDVLMAHRLGDAP